MKFKLYKIDGYESVIMSLRMSKGKFFSLDKAELIQDLVYCLTDRKGRLATEFEYNTKLSLIPYPLPKFTGEEYKKGELSGDYWTDVAELERLLELVLNNAMGEFNHHTLMKYLDIVFFTEGLHRGGQDDLDAHAMGFQNRITRFSTRLAEIPKQEISEWYEDKIMTFEQAHKHIGLDLPALIEVEDQVFKYTPFGYVLQKFADMSEKSGLYKDVMRGLMNLATPSNAIWKINLFDFRHVYASRSKIRTKANPELKDGIEMLADELEKSIIGFGKHVKEVYTSTGKWTHINKTKTLTEEEFKEYQKLKKLGE